MRRKIENIVDRILTESLQEKADEMVKKIKSEMQEEEELPIEDMSDDEIYDAYCQKFGCNDTEKESEFDTDGEVTSDDFGTEEMDMDMDDEEEGFDWEYRQGNPNYRKSNFDEEFEEGSGIYESKKRKVNEKLHGKQNKLDKNKNGKIDSEDFKLLRKKKEVKEKLHGKQKNLDKNKNNKIDAEDFKMLRKSSKKESVKLSESEIIDLIEKLVIEEKEKSNIKKTTAKGEEVYSKAHKESGKENEDYIKSVTKKLKDYLKDGSKGSYETNPNFFPKGNGELGKMGKKAYVPSKAAEEYIENFARMNGMEDLDYDEIHPVDDWISKNIEGSSETGNNPEWANTGKSETNKRLNNRRKKSLIRQLKRQAYNKAEQPVISDTTGESAEKSNSKLNKIFRAVESEEERKDRLITEEINKMNRLLNYNQKTQ